MNSIKIADLKTNLSRHLREVRRGHPIVVMDRETPVARIVPWENGTGLLVIRRPLGKYKSLQRVPLPPPLELDFDVVALLLEERQGER